MEGYDFKQDATIEERNGEWELTVPPDQLYGTYKRIAKAFGALMDRPGHVRTLYIETQRIPERTIAVFELRDDPELAYLGFGYEKGESVASINKLIEQVVLGKDPAKLIEMTPKSQAEKLYSILKDDPATWGSFSKSGLYSLGLADRDRNGNTYITKQGKAALAMGLGGFLEVVESVLDILAHRVDMLELSSSEMDKLAELGWRKKDSNGNSVLSSTGRAVSVSL
jgi:hypothetical protein